MLDRFNRALDDLATREAAARADDVADYLAIAGVIGQRLGEMHAVLAQPSDDDAFAPRQAGRDDAAAWIARAEMLVSRAFHAIRMHKNWDDEAAAAEATRLLSQE